MSGPVVPPTVMEPGLEMMYDNTWREAEEIKHAVGTVGQTCKSCHDNFRKELKK